MTAYDHGEEPALDVHEARRKRRFRAIPPLPAELLGFPVSVRDASAGGVQLQHTSQFRIGLEGALNCFLPVDRESVILPSRIVWSRMSSERDDSNRFVYYSGICFADEIEAIGGAVGRVIRNCAVSESGSLDEKRKSVERRIAHRGEGWIPLQQLITSDGSGAVRRVRDAIVLLRNDPVESLRWYDRAKYSHVHQPPGRRDYCLDVFAVWEYLERQYSLELIHDVYEESLGTDH